MVQLNNNYPNSCVVSDGTAVKRDLPLNFFMERYADAYRNEMIAFVDCCHRCVASVYNISVYYS
jgi:myo-inositol 2-dehydrogenase / D-chiro-inositol 1-dehydrogenase